MAEPHPHDELESPHMPGAPFVLTGIGVLAFLALSIGTLWAIFLAAAPGRIPPQAPQPPAPRLLADPPAELHAVWAEQRARLQGYRWVDRTGKIASIPIDRAMAMIAARGSDAYAPIPGAPAAPAPQVPELLQNLTHPQPPAPQQGNPPPAQPGAPP